jgi:hypothetical protein
MKSRNQNNKSSKNTKNPKAKFTSDTLEPRILMSATWVDVDDAQDQNDSAELFSSRQISQIEEMLNGLDQNDNETVTKQRNLFDSVTDDLKNSTTSPVAETFSTTTEKTSSSTTQTPDRFRGWEQTVNETTDGDDYIDASFNFGSNDFLYGGAGDDTLVGGSGDDFLVGGDGEDTAVYSGDFASYKISQNPDGTFSIIDPRGADGEGSDTLWSIEKLQFADREVYVDNLVFTDSDTPTADSDGNFRGPNLLFNGSFEAGQMSGWANRKDVPDWKHINTNEGIEVWADGFNGQRATDGSNFIELDSAKSVDGIFQELKTTAGQKYELSFDAAKRIDSPAGSDTIEVYWNGKQVASLSLTDPAWKTFSFTV